MLEKLNQIREGWFNHFRDLLGTLPEEIKIEGERRLNICYDCPMRTKFVCDPSKKGTVVRDFQYGSAQRTTGQTVRGCGCAIEAKAKSTSSLCPLGKW